ncbi:MAG: hypothetical protein FWG51_00905 [Firmicutes bacterium]|jgi:sporulation protein YlmC with PRC-barrel domain|nr:hypothetical protein [Bacillota bacterium]
MKKISDILGKNIISIYEGKKIGIIGNAAFDKKLKKLKSLIIYDDDSENIDCLIVPAACIALEGNAIMIKNLEKVTHDFVDEDCNPMNASVYNLNGDFLGNVSEILIDELTLEIHSLALSGNIVLQEQIVSSDFRTIVIKNLDEKASQTYAPKKRTLKNQKQSIPNRIKRPIVKSKIIEDSEVIKEGAFAEDCHIENDPKFETQAAPVQQIEPMYLQKEEEMVLKKEKEQKSIIPTDVQRLCANFNYLIGRRVLQDVLNVKGEKIAKRNAIISANMLEVCRKWGKLIMLARSSITWPINNE